MAIKNTITSNITNALRSKDNQQSPSELKQSGLLTSISKSMKLLVKQGRTTMRKQRDRNTFKVFTNMNKKLDVIKKNTKDNTKRGLGLIKFIVMIFVGMLLIQMFLQCL